MTVIETYIDQFDSALKPALIKLHEAIKSVLPNATEAIKWRMPTYVVGKSIIHFAVHKKHIGIYPFPDAIKRFENELKNYNTSKGAIQMPFDHIDYDLIKKIAQYNLEVLSETQTD